MGIRKRAKKKSPASNSISNSASDQSVEECFVLVTQEDKETLENGGTRSNILSLPEITDCFVAALEQVSSFPFTGDRSDLQNRFVGIVKDKVRM